MRRKKRTRRANGTGTVAKLSGNRSRPWEARVAGEGGKRECLGYFATKAEAEEALDTYNAQRKTGSAPPPGQLHVTLGQVWDAWSAQELVDAGKSKRGNYEMPWKRIVSQWADTPIRKINIDGWQEMINADVGLGTAPSTVAKTAALIHALCRYAMERDYIIKDYSQFIKLPAMEAKMEKGALSREQIGSLKKMVADHVPYADTVLALSYTGFRVEEFLSLTPSDYHPEYGGYLQGGSKTEAGKDRIVPVHPLIKPIIEEWMAKGGETIFCGKGGKRLRVDTYRYNFKKVVSALEIPQASPHWCRYTFSTMLHEAGVDELTQKWLMGHSTDKDITHHYTKSTIEQLVAAVNKLT